MDSRGKCALVVAACCLARSRLAASRSELTFVTAGSQVPGASQLRQEAAVATASVAEPASSSVPVLARLRARAATPLRRALSTQSMSYTERMEKTGRPISPHLTIYRLPLIAWSSVTVRVTGGMLAVGTAGVAGLSLVSGTDAVVETAQALGSSSIGPIAKFSVAFPLTYHLLGACRHAVWDLTAKGFTNQMMLQSSYALFGASTLISVALATCSLPPKKDEK